MGEESDTYSELRHLTPLWPLPRLRSLSDTSGFRSKVLQRLRGARSVDGLEKSSSLASCDVVVDSATNTQNASAPRQQQKGKLSSLGKLFKPWKWRKKKTSDKFQDLSKVLERKISTRQTREELIKKGVLIADQDEPISNQNLNGHATPSVTTEEVKVDIESPEVQLQNQASGPVISEEKPDKSDTKSPARTNQVRPPEAQAKKAQSATVPASSKPSGGAGATNRHRDGASGTKKTTKSTCKTGSASTQPKANPRGANNTSRVTAKSSHPKKTGGTSKTSSSSSNPRSRPSKDAAATAQTDRTEAKTNRKASSNSSMFHKSTAQTSGRSAGSKPSHPSTDAKAASSKTPA
uniref:Phosphatase and actin regulator n=1 Tax=Cynoglossus semilaevis TaxID=244447 RepID=A0A3P8UT20_CYNSE